MLLLQSRLQLLSPKRPYHLLTLLFLPVHSFFFYLKAYWRWYIQRHLTPLVTITVFLSSPASYFGVGHYSGPYTKLQRRYRKVLELQELNYATYGLFHHPTSETSMAYPISATTDISKLTHFYSTSMNRYNNDSTLNASLSDTETFFDPKAQYVWNFPYSEKTTKKAQFSMKRVEVE